MRLGEGHQIGDTGRYRHLVAGDGRVEVAWAEGEAILLRVLEDELRGQDAVDVACRLLDEPEVQHGRLAL